MKASFVLTHWQYHILCMRAQIQLGMQAIPPTVQASMCAFISYECSFFFVVAIGYGDSL